MEDIYGLDGRERAAITPAQAVALKHAGWRFVRHAEDETPEAPEAPAEQ